MNDEQLFIQSLIERANELAKTQKGGSTPVAVPDKPKPIVNIQPEPIVPSLNPTKTDSKMKAKKTRELTKARQQTIRNFQKAMCRDRVSKF